MAKKPLLDATSRPDSPYSDFTRGYRMSDNVIDNRNKDVAMRPSRTPRDTKSTISEVMFPGQFGGSTGRSRGDSGSTPDDYSMGAAEGGAVSKSTPGSGFPSVTSNQQASNYAPAMNDYIENSKKK